MLGFNVKMANTKGSREKLNVETVMCHDTQWQSPVNSVKAIRNQIGDVYDALIEVSETVNRTIRRTEVMSLAKALKKFNLFDTLVIWYDILLQINLSCKLLQSKTIPLDEAVWILGETNVFPVRFKQTGFNSAVATAKEVAEELEMSPAEMVFGCERSNRRRKTN